MVSGGCHSLCNLKAFFYTIINHLIQTSSQRQDLTVRYDASQVSHL